MRKLGLVVLGLGLAASIVYAAAESYSIDLTAAQVADLDWDRLRYNGDMCEGGGLPRDCTQAQLRAVPGHEVDNLYVDSLTGRQNFLRQKWVLNGKLAEVRAERSRRDTKSFCGWWTALTRANQDTYCSTFGLSAGCELCR